MNTIPKFPNITTLINPNYKYSVLCGLTGSLAALFAKEGLQQNNKFYKYIDTLPYPTATSLIFRIIFISIMMIANVKMIEFKIRSFAAIGSSLTVVAAFISNYLFNLIYEILLYYKFPSINQYIGSIFCLAGVFVLKDQISGETRDDTVKGGEEGCQEDCSVDSRSTQDGGTGDRVTGLGSGSGERKGDGKIGGMGNEHYSGMQVEL